MNDANGGIVIMLYLVHVENENWNVWFNFVSSYDDRVSASVVQAVWMD